MALDEMVKEVYEVLSIKHPIYYDIYNICELSARNKLGTFSKPMLQEICAAFDLDTSAITDKRKRQPYLDIIQDLAQSCSCVQSVWFAVGDMRQPLRKQGNYNLSDKKKMIDFVLHTGVG